MHVKNDPPQIVHDLNILRPRMWNFILLIKFT